MKVFDIVSYMFVNFLSMLKQYMYNKCWVFFKKDTYICAT